MGAINNAFQNYADRVDFAAVKAASAQSVESLVRRWLSGVRRKGDELVALNPTRADKKAGSFSINSRTGRWSDFATGERGGDMIDLYKYLFGGEILDAAKAVGDCLGVQPGASIHTLPVARRSAPTIIAPADTQREPSGFPPRTPPGSDGQPRFAVAGEEGPRRFGDEVRRHFYRVGTTAVRVKIVRSGDTRAVSWYRVTDTDGTTGWQSKKPEGYQPVPYVGELDAFDPHPFAPDQASKPLFWPEGEKDVQTIADKGGRAFCYGGCGDGLPHGCEEITRGRDVVILADNDTEGRKHADKKVALAVPLARSVRVVHFPELQHKGDVSDWFQRGGTFSELEKRAAAQPVCEKPMDPQPKMELPQPAPAPISATPYAWTEPGTIPRRDFVYGRHLIRKFVSATVAPGGVGKSSLIVSEVLAMVSGRDLLGVQPHGRSRVWLWNLEDPREEIARHIQATAKHFDMVAADLDGHLWVDSGRDQRLVTAVSGRDGTVILEPVIDNLVAEIRARGIDVLIVDPFVSSHEAAENDNPAQDRIVKAWGRVAQRGNCAVELIHHARKSSAGETEITVESSRGGKALTDGCRSVRVLNRMSKEEGENAGVENARLHFRTYIDKSNLAPPAESSTWFKLESVDLGNGENGGFGDSIGVVIPWQWPDLMADVSVHDLRAVQTLVSQGEFKHNSQAVAWVGKVIATVCRLDLSKPADKRKAANLLKIWLGNGALKQETRKDEKGRDAPFVVVGEWAND